MWQRKMLGKIWSATNSARYAPQRLLHAFGEPATMALRRGRVVAGGAGILALALAFASCARGNEGSQQPVVQAPAPVKVAPVSRGEIAATLSFPGEIQSVDQIDLLSVVGGRVLQINVEEGQEVSAGTVLAQLETDTLEAQVQQAGANVQSAQARLATVLEGARPQEIAASQAVLDSLREKLKGMIKGGRPEQITAAEANLRAAETKVTQMKAGAKSYDLTAAHAAVAASTSSVASAEANLARLQNPTKLDLEAAQAGVDSAKATLKSTQAALEDLKSRPKPADVAVADAAVKAATATLGSTESTMANLKRPLNKQTLTDLIDAYTGVNLAKGKLDQDRSLGASADVISADEEALLLAYRKLKLVEEDAGTFSAGVTVEAILAAQAAVDSARAALDSAQKNREKVLDGPTEADLQAAQAAVDKANSSLDTAQISFQKLQNPTAADLAVAQAAVENAHSARQAAQARLELLQEGATEDLLDAAKAAVAAAQQNLTLIKAPFTETDIAAQQSVIEQAAQQLWLTQNKYTRPDIATATAGVAQAEAALEVVKIQLKKATLVAPFDAIVAKKYVSTGALASAQTPVFSLVSKDVRVVFNVEEGSIGRLKSGLSVTFTAASLGEKAISGKITSISPVADAASRTFKVRVTPEGEPAVVKAGMFVNVAVAVEQRRNVLLVPRSAIVQQGNDSFVFVVQDGQAFQRKVAVGLSNDRVSEITSGLDEGQQVVTQGNKSLRSEDQIKVTS